MLLIVPDRVALCHVKFGLWVSLRRSSKQEAACRLLLYPKLFVASNTSNQSLSAARHAGLKAFHQVTIILSCDALCLILPVTVPSPSRIWYLCTCELARMRVLQ